MKVIGAAAISILLSSLIWQACGDRNAGEKTTSKKGKIDFNYHVKPILSDKCFACHGPDVKALKHYEEALRMANSPADKATIQKNIRKLNTDH